jgi:exoribonuclease R
MTLNYKYINYIRDSHDVVCYLMILMNYQCVQQFLNSHNGIFRSTIIKKKIPLPENLPEDVSNFITIWNNDSAQYIDLNSIYNADVNAVVNETCLRHSTLKMDAYVHITSPIRRLVDLLNMIKFQENKTLLILSPDAFVFYNKWIGEMEYINVTTRAIRKVQNECSLLDTCFNKPETLDKIYYGYCFDKLVRSDSLYQFTVFLPELKLTSRITIRENLDNYEKKQYKLYLFNNEEKFKRKIRLQII